MTHFRPPDVEGFGNWLNMHQVRDINIDDGVHKTTRENLLPKKTKRK